jgi:hypothetical protein
MPITFTSNESNAISITSEIVNPSTNELTITYRYNNGSPIVQTVANPTGPAMLMYHKPSTNIYWVYNLNADVQPDSEFAGLYNI